MELIFTEFYGSSKRSCNILLLIFCLLSSVTFAGEFANVTKGFNIPPKTIIGTINDQNGAPLPGVGVKVKDKNIATVTDANGKFTIDIPEGSNVLVISFIGFITQEISVQGRSSVSINLIEDVSQLDEVLVVGYGTQKKVNLTGAISTVDAKEIENRPVSNVASALQGTMAGFVVTRTSGQPGDEGIDIQVRGATSASGNVNPLLVVDGIITPLFTLQTMNPNDIETISVLKDASSASIYGAQAAGGVILVTTKTGKSGKTKFDYSNLIGVDKAMNVPERLTLLEEATYSNLAQVSAGFPAEYSAFDLENIRNGVQYVVNPNNPEFYIHYNTKDQIKETLRDYDLSQTHNISASGGTDKLNYLASFGLYDKKGVFKVGPDGLRRYNARFNVGTQLTKHLSFDSKISYSLNKTEGPYTAASGAGLLFVTYKYRQQYPIFNPEGTLNGHGGVNTTYAQLREGGYNNVDRNYFDGVFTLKAKEIIKGLQLRTVYGAQYRTDVGERFFRTIELWARLNPIRYINPTNRFDVTNGLIKNNNVQFLSDYDFKLGNKNNFHILAGYQWEDSRTTSVFTSVSGLVNNNVPSLSLGNQAGKVATDDVNTYAYQSVFGRLNYNHADKYLFEFTIRNDESSRLAPGQRNKIFPAASIGWNAHMEDWFSKALPFVSTFKPRVSWGQMGSAIGIGNYSYLDLLTSNSNVVLGNPGLRSTYFFQNTVASSTLTWETIETANAGLDLGLANNKIQIGFDYYTKFNRNMLTPLVLPSAFGIGAPRVNNGTLKSWGWELEAAYNSKIKETVSYSVGFNLSDNQNKLISYSGQRVILPGFVGALEGYPLNTLWGYQTDGYFQTKAEVTSSAFQNTITGAGDVKYRDLNGDGVINGGKGTVDDHGDLINIGTTQPRFSFGFNGSMRWKGVDFSFFLQGVGRRTFYPTSRAIQPMQFRNEQINKIHLDYWTPENPNAAFPRPFATGNHNFLPSDKWMLDGKYIRLKNVQLGYSLPTNWLQKIKVSRARIFFSGQDILTFSGLGIFSKMLNPETKDTGNFGADYPFFGTATVGVNIGF